MNIKKIALLLSVACISPSIFAMSPQERRSQRELEKLREIMATRKLPEGKKREISVQERKVKTELEKLREIMAKKYPIKAVVTRPTPRGRALFSQDTRYSMQKFNNLVNKNNAELRTLLRHVRVKLLNAGYRKKTPKSWLIEHIRMAIRNLRGAPKVRFITSRIIQINVAPKIKRRGPTTMERVQRRLK